MNVVFLGLGGNMGNRLENLKEARKQLEIQCGQMLKVSGIYETDAWGSDSEKKYLNQVVKLSTTLNAEQLLEKTSAIEEALGRKRTAEQNSDRTLDIDILLFNDAVIELKHIHIPHPRLHLRKFVLVPLCEIEEQLIHPKLKKSMENLLKESEDELEVRKI